MLHVPKPDTNLLCTWLKRPGSTKHIYKHRGRFCYLVGGGVIGFFLGYDFYFFCFEDTKSYDVYDELFG